MARRNDGKNQLYLGGIKADIAEGKNGGRVQTRLPARTERLPAHGHVKALSVDFDGGAFRRRVQSAL